MEDAYFIIHPNTKLDILSIILLTNIHIYDPDYGINAICGIYAHIGSLNAGTHATALLLFVLGFFFRWS